MGRTDRNSGFFFRLLGDDDAACREVCNDIEERAKGAGEGKGGRRLNGEIAKAGHWVSLLFDQFVSWFWRRRSPSPHGTGSRFGAQQQGFPAADAGEIGVR